MASINFPNSPSHGDTFNVTNASGSAVTYSWDSNRSYWKVFSGAPLSIDSAGVDSIGTLTLTLTDGNVVVASGSTAGPTGASAPTIVSGSVDSAGVLTLVLSDGDSIQTSGSYSVSGVTTGKAIAMAIVFG